MAKTKQTVEAKLREEIAGLRQKNERYLEMVADEIKKNGEQKKVITRFRALFDKASPDFKIEQGGQAYYVYKKHVYENGETYWAYEKAFYGFRAKTRAIAYAGKKKRAATEFVFV